MNRIIVKVFNKSEQVNDVVAVIKSGKVATLEAQGGVNYEFFDEAIGRGPNHVITKRVDDNLLVSFEQEGEVAELLIKDFYTYSDEQALIGIAENGNYYYYIPDTGEVTDYTTSLIAGQIEGQALGGTELAAPFWVPVGSGGVPLWLLGGVVAAGAAVGASGGADSSSDADNPKGNNTGPLVSLAIKDKSDKTITVKEDVGTVTYVVSLSEASTKDVVVKLTIPNTATADATEDFTFTSGALEVTIPAGQTSAEITFNITHDGTKEDQEQYDLQITDVDSRAIIDTQNDSVTTVIDDVTQGSSYVSASDWTGGNFPNVISYGKYGQSKTYFYRTGNDIDNTGAGKVVGGRDDLPSRLKGGKGNDEVIGGANNDTLDGGGYNISDAESGIDTLHGGAGNDTLIFGTGDTIDGGDDFDTLLFTNHSGNLTLDTDLLSNIEKINLTDDNLQIIKLQSSDIIDITGTQTLWINGDAQDTLKLENNFIKTDDNLGKYNKYATTDGTVVFVANDIETIIL